MASISVRKYQPADQQQWNGFVMRSKNATFLFDRRFMDYHADRFKDHSLLVFQDGGLKAVMAANEDGASVVSHGGLSYGGLLLEKETHLDEVLKYFFHLLKYLHETGFSSLTYKCIPSYLTQVPSNEDHYALFLVNAVLVRRDMSAAYSRSQSLPFRDNRQSIVKKAITQGCDVVRT